MDDERIKKFKKKIEKIAENFADNNSVLAVLHGIIDGDSYTPPTPESVKGIADAFLQEIKDSKVFSKFTHDDTNTNNDVTGLRIRYTDKPNTNDSELIDLVDITGRFNSTNLFSLVKLTFSAKTIGRVSFGNAYGPFDITFTAYGDKSTMSISPSYEQLCENQRGRSAILEAGLNKVVDYYKVFSILENSKPDTVQKPSAPSHQLTQEEQAALDAEQAAKNKDDYIKRKNENIKAGISKLDIMSNEFYYSLGFLAATTKSIIAIIPVPDPTDPNSPCKYVDDWFDNRFGYSTPRKNPQTTRTATGRYTHYGPIFKLSMPYWAVNYAPNYLLSGIQSESRALFGKNEAPNASCLKSNGSLSNIWLITLLVENYGFRFAGRGDTPPAAPTITDLLNRLAGISQDKLDAVQKGYDDGKDALTKKGSAQQKDTEENIEDDIDQDPLDQDFPNLDGSDDDGFDESFNIKKSNKKLIESKEFIDNYRGFSFYKLDDGTYLAEINPNAQDDEDGTSVFGSADTLDDLKSGADNYLDTESLNKNYYYNR